MRVVDPPRPPVAPGRHRTAFAAVVRALTLLVNGEQRAVRVSPGTSLLMVLRNDLSLTAPKYGCGLGQCGACTVHVDGIAARACVIPAAGVVGRRITTLEGLGSAEDPHPVQQAFIDEQAAQCGYCLNGMIMTAAAFLATTPDPDERQVRAALSGNLCRCGTHVEIIRAVLKAAELLRERTGSAADSGAGIDTGVDAGATAVTVGAATADPVRL